MKNLIKETTENIINGHAISKETALRLINISDDSQPLLDHLFKSADMIRTQFCGNTVELCSIINAKSGLCSEDCKFCSQSVHYNTSCDQHGLLEYKKIYHRAKEMEALGVHKFSLVTSGYGIDNQKDLDELCSTYKQLQSQTHIGLCASHGIINESQARALKEAGVETYHHNIEACKGYYDKICTTHSYEERVATVQAAKKAGLSVCCGGIIGLGESLEDRIHMAFEIKNLDVKSVPINVFMPIEGTPLENTKVLEPMEILKTLAVFRLILPKAKIRYAGGRVLLSHYQKLGLKSGINALLTGNYLTTIGNDTERDIKMVKEAELILK